MTSVSKTSHFPVARDLGHMSLDQEAALMIDMREADYSCNSTSRERQHSARARQMDRMHCNKVVALRSCLARRGYSVSKQEKRKMVMLLEMSVLG